MGEIVICGHRYGISSRVSCFADGGLDISGATGVSGQPLVHPRKGVSDIVGLAAAIDAIVIHHDGCRDVSTCFKVLVERELSTHFIIARDGLIHQIADPIVAAVHAGPLNGRSIGIDLSNPADNLIDNPRAEPPPGGTPSATVAINGVDFRSWTYTDAQYEALNELTGLICETLDVPARLPQTAGRTLMRSLEPNELKAYSGILFHWHADPEKWDPGPGFDIARLKPLGAWYGATIPVLPDVEFPFESGDSGSASPGRAFCLGLASADPDAAVELVDSLCDVVDRSIDGGWYPVGVNGGWHGGIHIPCVPTAPVYPIAAGEIVAAAAGRAEPEVSRWLGSDGFVVVRHDHPVLPQPGPWYSVYMHLERPDSGRSGHPMSALLAGGESGGYAPHRPGVRPRCLRGSASVDRTAAYLGGWTVLLPGEGNVPVRVTPDDVIGFAAHGGSVHGRSAGLVHVEVFRVPDGQSSPSGNVIIDRSSDLTVRDPGAKSLVERARASARQQGEDSWQPAVASALRRSSVVHMSEWSSSVDWVKVLDSDAGTKAMLENEKPHGLFSFQAAAFSAFAWLDSDVCRHLGLGPEGIVESVHPLMFMLACARAKLPCDVMNSRRKALKSGWKGTSLMDRIIKIWSE